MSIPRDLVSIEDAIRDALAGWRYLRECHGDLYGVGWKRVEKKLAGALIIAALSYPKSGDIIRLHNAAQQTDVTTL